MRWLPAWLAAVGAFCVVFIARCLFRDPAGHWRVSLFDDAMISMRYAKHLAAGHGLVWNVGEDPIEGFSNPLWTLVMAVLHLLPIPRWSVPLAVMVVSAVLLLLNVVVVVGIARHLAPSSTVAAVVAAVLVGTYYPVLYWSLRGMEVGMLALLVDVAILLALRGDAGRWLVLTLIALVLTRTDAAVPAAVVVAWSVWRAPSERRVRTGVVLGGALVGTLVAMTLFRLAYFGDALPNTYYLKMTGVPLDQRISAGYTHFRVLAIIHLLPVLLLAAAGFVVAVRAGASAGFVLLAGVAGGQVAYSVFVGGDAWEYTSYANRYIAIGMPAAFVVAALGVAGFVRERTGAALTTAALFGGAAVAALIVREKGRRIFFLAGWSDAEVRPRLLALAAVFAALALAAPVVARALIRHPRVGTAAIAVVAVAAINGQGVTTWWRHNAVHEGNDRATLVRGLVVRAGTEEGATVAAYWAGNGPWASDRRTLDLYGKSDRRIAKVPPSPTFRPGHNKRDLEYSVGQLRPDVVDLGPEVALSAEDEVLYKRWGYEFRNGFEILVGSPHVDPERFERGLSDQS